MGRSRLDPLHRGKHVRIQRYLQNRIPLRFARELRIGNFVRPGTEPTRRFHAAEHVGPAVPSPRLQCSLNDDRIAAGHGLQGRRNGLGIEPYSIDHRHGHAERLQVVDEGLFVRGTALGKGLKNRIPDLGLLKLALDHFEIEFRQIRTVQVSDQIGRTQVQIPTDVLHFPPRCRSPATQLGRPACAGIMPFS